MVKKSVSPKKLTIDEENLINNYFFLHEFEFELFIGDCTEVSKCYIRWESDQPVQAFVYGVNAQYVDSGKPCISNFFIKYGRRLYQANSMLCAADIIKLLVKEYKYDQHLQKLWKARVHKKIKNKRQKLLNN